MIKISVPNNKKIHPNLSFFLDFTRFIAAFLVMAGHLRGAFFVPYGELSGASQNIFNYLLFFVTRVGHECVIIFFILSGYLVGGNLLIDAFNKKVNWQKYFIDRITRMWVVLIPVLILGFGMDLYRANFLNDAYLVQNFSHSTFWGNILFLHTIFTPIFTSNHPLWSLAYEFWYYMLCPLLIIPFYLKFNKVICAFLVILLIALFYSIMPQITFLFPLWILGAALRFIPTVSLFKHRLLILPIATLFAFSVYYSNVNHNQVGNYLVGISFSLILLYQVINNQFRFFNLSKIFKRLADFSFSLYATHFFFLLFIRAFLNKHADLNIRLQDANITNWTIYSLIAIILMVLAWLFYYTTERNTYYLRNKISKRLSLLFYSK